MKPKDLDNAMGNKQLNSCPKQKDEQKGIQWCRITISSLLTRMDTCELERH